VSQHLDKDGTPNATTTSTAAAATTTTTTIHAVKVLALLLSISFAACTALLQSRRTAKTNSKSKIHIIK
jgi:hypothetical protein